MVVMLSCGRTRTGLTPQLALKSRQLVSTGGRYADMSTMTAEKVETLNACFGNYPHTQALKKGDIKSDRVALRLTEVEPINKAFLLMVRQAKFDVSEMAIATYLQAKAYDKPFVLIPTTMMGRFQHGTMLYNSERGTVTPESLSGKRVGVRA